jgi:hypothetical protein
MRSANKTTNKQAIEPPSCVNVEHLLTRNCNLDFFLSVLLLVAMLETQRKMKKNFGDNFSTLEEGREAGEHLFVDM